MASVLGITEISEANLFRQHIRATFEVNPNSQHGFNYEGNYPASCPDRESTIDGWVLVRPNGIFIGCHSMGDITKSRLGFYSSQGGGDYSFSDAVWAGEFFFKHFVVLTVNQENEIVDIDDF